MISLDKNKNIWKFILTFFTIYAINKVHKLQRQTSHVIISLDWLTEFVQLQVWQAI